MTIGLMCAIPQELSHLRDALSHAQGEEVAHVTFCAGELDGHGVVLSGDQYLHCAITRDRLHRELGGLAIEMEGGALAQICESFGIPWLVIRALSDLAGGDSRFEVTAPMAASAGR